jgi:hypothetical protein
MKSPYKMNYNLSIISWELYNGDLSKNESHIIALPNRCLDDIISIDESTFITVSINNAIQIGNCEVVQEENIIVVPYWIISKLNLEQFDTVVVHHIQSINIKQIGRIKIRATISDYAMWEDIKKILENELSQFRIINCGDVISIYGIEFYIVELFEKTTLDTVVSGSIYNTDVELDFDLPMDDALQDEMIKPQEDEYKYLSRRMLAEHKARLAILDSMSPEEYSKLPDHDKSRHPRKQKISLTDDSGSENEMDFETIRFPGLFPKRVLKPSNNHKNKYEKLK